MFGRRICGLHCRNMSQMANSHGRVLLVDTLLLAKKLEGQGLPSKQAEAIVEAIQKVSTDSMENASQSFLSKGELDKIKNMYELKLSKFQSDLKSSKDYQLAVLKLQVEKLGESIDNTRTELRREMSQLTEEATETLHSAIVAHIGTTKYDVQKYYIWIAIGVVGVGVAFFSKFK